MQYGRHLRSPRLASWLVCLVIALVPMKGWSAPPPWPEVNYSYYAENVPLESVLNEFANSFSLLLVLSPGVSGQVNGRFTSKSPTEFIGRLGGVYGFSWYAHGGTLFVSRTSDNAMRSIVLPDGAGQLKGVLIELGVVDPRFGWAQLPDQRVVIVSGPRSYLDLVEATLQRLPGSSSRQVMRVFRLRFASAEDRLINYRGSASVQPGLTTVLRKLIGGRAAIGAGIRSDELNMVGAPITPAPSLAAPRAAAGAVPLAGDAVPAGPPAAQAQAAMPADRGIQVRADPRFQVPSIQSDPRLNAIIIQDQPERMPVYAQLIAQLDQPSPLIEIEAMIVDVNSERARELGINWAVRKGETALNFGTSGSLSGPGTLSLAQGAAGASTLITNGGLQLLAQLRLLENSGDARIQSRPSILTMDNISALLDLSETFYVRVQGERVASVSPITAGTTLKVTPRLIDGPVPAIQLTVDIEDGQIQDRQVDTLPTVRRSTVSTQAIIRQDETLLIAGYATDQNVVAEQKVPGLGDLPGIGALFSNTVSTVQKRERLFMIRPKLVGMPYLKPLPAP